MDNILKIVKLDSDGCGVGRLGERVVLVSKVLPEEEIKIQQLEHKKKYDIANFFTITKASEERCSPVCPHFVRCGGCSFQHVSQEYERNFKINKVKMAFRHIANVDILIDQFIDNDKLYGYRNKMAFVVKDYNTGMYENDSKNFIPIDKCLLISEKMNKVYNILSQWINEEKVSNINHIVIREVGEYYSITLVGEIKPEIDKLIQRINCIIKNKYHIVFNRNNANKEIISDDLELLYGVDIYDTHNDIKYQVSPNSFLQVNKYMSSKLYDDIKNLVKDKILINAYSGAGLLTAILAKKVKKVYGVEVVKNAHLNAQLLIKNNRINNVINLCGKAEKLTPQILNKIKDSTIVVDPPRSGINKSLLNVINGNINIKNFIYVSCNPNSLARDIKLLDRFRIKECRLYDMFPRTAHIETMCVLERM